ncbi:MAG: tryptophan-rich sensory protein [Arenibacter latericius]|nr:tryptophan-rich sensory protein [Arenibacter latericius]
MKKTLQISNALALLITIAVNYLSNTGIINGNTMKTVSDLYYNYFTPAGYAFSIWGIIYIGLLGFVVYTGRSLFKGDAEEEIVKKIGWWFVISCIGNSLWVIAWLNLHIGTSVLLMSIVLFALLKIIANTRMELDTHPLKKYLLIFWPFAIYTGWISVAFIANIAAYLTKINWNGWGITEINWTIIMIVVAGLINILMVLKRNLREYALVGIWALIAIAVSNKENGNLPIVFASYIVAAIIFVFISISAYNNRASSPSGM